MGLKLTIEDNLECSMKLMHTLPTAVYTDIWEENLNDIIFGKKWHDVDFKTMRYEITGIYRQVLVDYLAERAK